MIDRPYQPHRSSGGNPSNHDHLQRSPQSSQYVPLPTPPHHNGRLCPSKREQRNDHDTDTPPQRQHDLVPPDAEVRDQGRETSDEVTDTDGDGADKWPGISGLGHLVVEAHEEVEHFRGGLPERFGNTAHC